MSGVADHKRKLAHELRKRVSTKTLQRRSFARLLKSAVIMSWTDLFCDGQSGTVHMDCRFGNENAVEHLTIWAATERGEWRLAGEYSRSRAKKSIGMIFENSDRSEKLACTLDTILEHQHSFTPLPNPGRDGLIEIEQPTPRQRRMAESAIASMLRSLQPA